MNIRRIYSRDVDRLHRRFTRQEEAELAAKARAGDASAREKLLCSILPFVVKIASRYRNRGIAFMYLVQAGNEGALEAVDKLKPSAGRLTTLAYQWIRMRIRYEIDTHASTIRVARGILDGSYDRKGSLTEQERNDAKKIFFGTLSLDDSLPGNKNDHDNDKTLGSFIPDRSRPLLDELIDRERAELESAMIDLLPIRQSSIVRMRLEGKSLDEIGAAFGVSGEAIRQQMARAVAMLQEMRPIEPEKTASNSNEAIQASDRLIYSHVPTDVY